MSLLHRDELPEAAHHSVGMSSDSITIEYTDQYITESKNHSCPSFIFSTNNLSISLHLRFFQYTWSVYYQYTCTAHYAAALNCKAQQFHYYTQARHPVRFGLISANAPRIID